MAVRALTLLLLAVLAFSPAPAAACFGPKLYIGVPADARGELLFALVSLYLKEKTGVDAEEVALTGTPAEALQADRVDLVFSAGPLAAGSVALELPDGGVLVSGPRPREDLQFTTVLPALVKLERMLDAAALRQLEERAAAGEPPRAAARHFLMEREWI